MLKGQAEFVDGIELPGHARCTTWLSFESQEPECESTCNVLRQQQCHFSIFHALKLCRLPED